MVTLKKEIKSRVDLHSHSNFGIGKDSILRLYNQSLKQNLAALIITDKYPLTGYSNSVPFYSIQEFLIDLEELKKEGWQQKIPIIVGMEYTWPEWLIGGFSVKTLIFGSKAIDQLMGLEKYRKIDGLDREGKILKLIQEEVEVIILTISATDQFRLLRYSDGSEVVQRYNDQKQRWINTTVEPEKIPPSARRKHGKTEIKRRIPSGETLTEVWQLFKSALMYELEEDELTGELKPGKGIESAVILCSPDPNQINVQKKELVAILPEYFIEIIDAVEVSYSGFSKQVKGKNYSLEAFNFANSINTLPLINSDATQAITYGIADSICNEFNGKINSEKDLINLILDRKITPEHLKQIQIFCANARDIELTEEGLAKNIQAQEDLGIVFASGEGDEH